MKQEKINHYSMNSPFFRGVLFCTFGICFVDDEPLTLV